MDSIIILHGVKSRLVKFDLFWHNLGFWGFGEFLNEGIIIFFEPGNINLSYCAVDSPSVPLKPTIRFHYANNAGR